MADPWDFSSWYEELGDYPDLEAPPAALPPVVAFIANVYDGEATLSVDFTDLSTNLPTSWSWSFGAGANPETSTIQNPTVLFDTPGLYTITLTATNAYGSDTGTAFDIDVRAPFVLPAADFVGVSVEDPLSVPPVGHQPCVIDFTDLSTIIPTSWYWDFGDGGTSTSQNPSHTYIPSGVYTVSLTATNDSGFDVETKNNYVTVLSAAPIADFTADKTEDTWYYGQQVDIQFTDLTINYPESWYWEFGDGTTSTLQNPAHGYSSPGSYNVSLTASKSDGSDSITKYSYINVLSPGGPDPSGMRYSEYYLYSDKAWEMAPSGVSSFNLAHAVQQNAPVIVTASGYETTDSTQPWGQVKGTGKYNKVGYGYFTLLENGQYNPNATEFSLHPDSSGKIAFNGTLRENVYIEYEAGPSGYYIMDSIDYNPVRAEVGGGFVHFSQTTAPAFLYLSASQSEIRAEGSRGCKFTAIVYDEDFDRVPEETVVFEIQNLLPALDAPGDVWSELGYLVVSTTGTGLLSDASGQMIELSEVTSRRGEVTTRYTANDIKTGITQIKAYVLGASGVYDTARVAQYYLNQEPFILDLSLLDTLDYLT